MSKFKEDGLKFLKEKNESRLKPSMLDCWYDGEKLLQLLDQYKLRQEKDLVKKYYIKKDEDEDEQDSYDIPHQPTYHTQADPDQLPF